MNQPVSAEAVHKNCLRVVPELKRKMRSRMRQLHMSGTKRSPGLSLVFA
jgi:hypothetical protein